MTDFIDLALIGGGASGAFAALAARQAGFTGSLLLFEKEEEAFRKILASGNGRCNLANYSEVRGRYRGEDPAFALDILARYPAPFITDLFEKYGLLTWEEREGRVYPRSLQARSVALILARALEEAGAVLEYSSAVERLEKIPEGFLLGLSDGREVRARSLIAAGGSPASPQLGGSALSYELLQGLGHKLKDPVPALVPLVIPDHPLIRYAQGVRFRGRALYRARTGESRSSQGEYLITSYGLSGIAAMELGSLASRSPGSLEIDFLPERDQTFIEDMLGTREARTALAGLVPEKIGRALLSLVTREQVPLARLLKRLTVEVEGTRGFDFAQVAAGGILTSDFDVKTLMSRKASGLFACGELLDIDGDTGGFNLLWAFSSGYLAGRSAALYLMGQSS